MVRVSTAIVLAAVAAVPAFAAPVAFETRDSQGIEPRAPQGPHYQQSLRETIRDFDRFDIEVRMDKKAIEKIGIEKVNLKATAYSSKGNINNIVSNDPYVEPDGKTNIVKFNSQPKSKKGKQRRSIGFPLSPGSVMRSTSPSYNRARRSFIEDDPALETRGGRRRKNHKQALSQLPDVSTQQGSKNSSRDFLGPGFNV
ncbi:hypothetical protein BKA70DRAFT_99734 [Coprinopsis sp. MPI-PUGE-AT-0042]|nr:hypothetical protein BKA70DRAFT_99734 [Coprinopsis sp. MPI-PUGE-AT-0042]